MDSNGFEKKNEVSVNKGCNFFIELEKWHEV